MNWKQRLVIISGIAFIGVNLFFPRDYCGNRYHFFTKVYEYQAPEMIMRQLTLLLLLIVVLALLHTGTRALKIGQKLVLLIGMLLWVLVCLSPPNAYAEFRTYYFSKIWDTRVNDYSFAYVLWVFIFGYTALLTSILGHPLSRGNRGAIWWSFGVLMIGFIIDGQMVREDQPTFGPAFLLAGVVGMILLGLTLIKLKKLKKEKEVVA